jgi:VIT1/CCC1 family predicted Fe2+/Mn2+ transporter
MAKGSVNITEQVDNSIQASGAVNEIAGDWLSSPGNFTKLGEGSVLADEVMSNTNLSNASNSGNTTSALTGTGNTMEQLGANTRDVLLSSIQALKDGTDSVIAGITKTTGLNLQPYTSKDITSGTETQRSAIEIAMGANTSKSKTGMITAAVVAVVVLMLFFFRKGKK